jgi:hypothetical protein
LKPGRFCQPNLYHDPALQSNDADIVSSGNIVHFADERINAAASAMPSLTRFRSLATLQEKASMP